MPARTAVYRIVFRSLFAAIITLHCSAIAEVATDRAGVLPVDQPEYRTIYDWWHYRQVDTSRAIGGASGPYRLAGYRYAQPIIDHLAALDHSRLILFGSTRAEIASAKEMRARSLESIRLGLAAQPHRRVALYASFLLDEGRAEDPTYSGKKYRGLAGDVEYAYLHLTAGRFDALLGRFGSFWGDRRSVLMAGHTLLDGLEIGYERRRFGIRYRLGRLDALQVNEDTVGAMQERYVALHRLALRPWDEVEIGLFEAIVFGGVGRSLDFYYLNPLLSFHSSQLNEDRNDNTLLGFDWHMRPARGWKMQGQLLIDDLQIDNETPADKEPAQYALRLSAATTRLAPHTHIAVRYTRVTNWTFNQSLPRNRYLFERRPLGDLLGNDYEQFTLDVDYWFSALRHISAGLEYLRRGEGRVDASWDAPWLTATSDYNEPFPTGVVETIWQPSLGGAAFVADHLLIRGTGGVRFVTNDSHQLGRDRTVPFLQLSISLFGDLAVPLD